MLKKGSSDSVCLGGTRESVFLMCFLVMSMLLDHSGVVDFYKASSLFSLLHTII